MEIKRGDIFLANLKPVVGSEQGKIHPVLVIQNNLGNKFSPLTIIASITSKLYTKEFSTNVFLSKEDSKLKVDSTILLNQIRSVDKSRIIKKLGSLNNFIMNKVNIAIIESFGLK